MSMKCTFQLGNKQVLLYFYIANNTFLFMKDIYFQLA